jgi:hypothetical protein
MYSGTKSIFASKTFWGAAIAATGAGINLFGYTVSPADQTAAVDAVSALITAGGSLLAVFGRIRATRAIG